MSEAPLVTLTMTDGKTYTAPYTVDGFTHTVVGRTAREFIKTYDGDYVAVDSVTHMSGLDEARKAAEEQAPPDPPEPVRHGYQFVITDPEVNKGVCSCECEWRAVDGAEITEADAGVYYAQHIEEVAPEMATARADEPSCTCLAPVGEPHADYCPKYGT